jgi:hypothetical protein
MAYSRPRPRLEAVSCGCVWITHRQDSNTLPADRRSEPSCHSVHRTVTSTCTQPLLQPPQPPPPLDHLPRWRKASLNEVVADLFQPGLDRAAERCHRPCVGGLFSKSAEARWHVALRHIDRKLAPQPKLIGNAALHNCHQHRIGSPSRPACQPCEHDRICNRRSHRVRHRTGGPAQHQDQQDCGGSDRNVKRQKGLRVPVQGVQRHEWIPVLISSRIVEGRDTTSQRNTSTVRNRGRAAKRMWAACQNCSGGRPKNRRSE